MRRLIVLLGMVVFVIACHTTTEKKTDVDLDVITTEVVDTVELKLTTINKESKTLHFANGVSHDSLLLEKPAVIVVMFDSIEVEQLRELEGEDDFYTGADDLMYYDSLLNQKMDSLAMPVMYTDKDRVLVQAANLKYTIVKDTSFMLYTYFEYNGTELKKVDLFELLDR